MPSSASSCDGRALERVETGELAKEKENSKSLIEEGATRTCGGWQVTLNRGRRCKPGVTWTWCLRIPPPCDGYVRVRLVAAGISPLDCFFDSLESGEYPFGVGIEGAGVVECLGYGINYEQVPSHPSICQAVSDLHLGDPVVVLASQTKSSLVHDKSGTFSSFINVEASLVVKIPQGASDFSGGNQSVPLVDFTEAATIPVSGVTACFALKEKLRVEKGRSIYIHGASGGVGSVMVQLAHRLGLFVIASCSTSHMDYVRLNGADVVLDYSSVKSITTLVREATNGVGVDYAVDSSSAQDSEDLTKLLRFGGSLCVVSNRNRVHTNFLDVWHRQLSIHYISLLNFLETPRGLIKWRKMVEYMLNLYASESIQVFLEEVPLNHAAVALDVLRGGHVMGKLVLINECCTNEKDGRTTRTRLSRQSEK